MIINDNEKIELFAHMTEYLRDADWFEEFDEFYNKQLLAIAATNKLNKRYMCAQLLEIDADLAAGGTLFILEQFFCQKLSDGRNFIDDYVDVHSDCLGDKYQAYLRALNNSKFDVYGVTESDGRFKALSLIEGRSGIDIPYDAVGNSCLDSCMFIGLRLFDCGGEISWGVGTSPLALVDLDSVSEAVEAITGFINDNADTLRSLSPKDSRRYTSDENCIIAAICHIQWFNTVITDFPDVGDANYADPLDFTQDEQSSGIDVLLNNLSNMLNFNLLSGLFHRRMIFDDDSFDEDVRDNDDDNTVYDDGPLDVGRLFGRLIKHLQETDWFNVFDKFFRSHLDNIMLLGDIEKHEIYKNLLSHDEGLGDASTTFLLEQFFCAKSEDGDCFIDDYLFHCGDHESESAVAYLNALKMSSFNLFMCTPNGDHNYIFKAHDAGAGRNVCAPFVSHIAEKTGSPCLAGCRLLELDGKWHHSVGFLPVIYNGEYSADDILKEFKHAMEFDIESLDPLAGDNGVSVIGDPECLKALMCHSHWFYTYFEINEFDDDYDNDDLPLFLVQKLTDRAYAEFSGVSEPDTCDICGGDVSDGDEVEVELDLVKLLRHVFDDEDRQVVDKVLYRATNGEPQSSVTLSYDFVGDSRSQTLSLAKELFYEPADTKFVLAKQDALIGYFYINKNNVGVFILVKDHVQEIKNMIKDKFSGLLKGPEYRIN